MPENKNQHYVPKCHLKPFTLNGAGSAINLYNVKLSRAVSNASVKDQCARDYFYGKIPAYEDVLQNLEGWYGSFIASIVEPTYGLTNEDRHYLKLFALLQYCRTDAAARRVATMGNELADFAFVSGEAKDMHLSHADSVRLAMSMFAGALEMVADLKVVLVRNGTSLGLITSDDPAVLSNRLYAQKLPMPGRGGGLGNSGALIYLPLTPCHGSLIYDGDVYTAPHENGWVELKGDDVASLNEQQQLNCRMNLYFSEWQDLDTIREQARLVSDRRVGERHQMRVAVPEPEQFPGWESFRVVSREEAQSAERSMIHLQSTPPRFSRWPSVLKWRSGAHGYSNGSGAGLIRRWILHALRGNDPTYRKVHL